MKQSWLVLVLALSLPLAAGAEEKKPDAGADETTPELWVGHQVVTGGRSVPLLGKVKTRTDSFFLATVERLEGGAIRLEQRTCKVEIAPAAGVQVSFLPDAPPKLPAATVELRQKGDRWHATFLSGWGEEDADGDGNPGVTMVVDAPLCSGKLFVASDSRTQLRGSEKDGGLAGETRAVSTQKTIGADGACLKMMAKDERDSVQGTFAYVPAPAGATCESLRAAGWPIRAPEPRS